LGKGGSHLHLSLTTVFGVGYTSISGAIKKARQYLENDDLLKKQVLSILNGI